MSWLVLGLQLAADGLGKEDVGFLLELVLHETDAALFPSLFSLLGYNLLLLLQSHLHSQLFLRLLLLKTHKHHTNIPHRQKV